MSMFVAILISILAVSVAILLVIYVLVPLFAIIGKLIAHVSRFVGGMFSDTLRAIGALLTAILLSPLVVGTIVIGRWSAAAHFGRAVQREIGVCFFCIYRVFIGHPARLLGLRALTEGIEQRVPDAMAKAPGSDKPSRRSGQFDGYTIVGSLPGGGSGARIFVAEPDERKIAIFSRSGHADITQVVIKSFSVHDGSSLPQIIRESRSLEAARRLGLVLDHELDENRFFYVMPYVPGRDLTSATRALHDAAGQDGLARKQLDEALIYAADLLTTLDRYHSGGLWHKDVKPDNIIVHDGRAHLVDLGLVTPIRSAMTLTTHGTEYFRDPEMVRMALRGVKVHEVDGAKFDIYASGAVLFSMIENSFPAHGGLSQITRKCPDALKLIIRRAMTDYHARYEHVPSMLADLRVVIDAPDPYAVKPADLPSMRGESPERLAEAVEEVRHAASPLPQAPPAVGRDRPATESPRSPVPDRPNPLLRVTDWWKGRYEVAGDRPARANRDDFGVHAYGVSIGARGVRAHAGPVRPIAIGLRPSADEQLRRARARVDSARHRVESRMRSRTRLASFSNKPNAGVGLAVGLTFGVLGAAAVLVYSNRDKIDDMVRRAQINTGSPFNLQFDAPADEFRAAMAKLRDNDSARRALESVVTAIDSLDGISPDDSRARVASWIDTATASATTTTLPPKPADATGEIGSILVLDELRDATPDIRRGYVNPIADALTGLGLSLIRADDGPEAADLIAQARKELGSIPPQPDDQFRATVARWLATQPKSLRGVLLFRWTTPGADAEPAATFFSQRGFDGVWLQRHLPPAAGPI